MFSLFNILFNELLDIIEFDNFVKKDKINIECIILYILQIYMNEAEEEEVSKGVEMQQKTRKSTE